MRTQTQEDSFVEWARRYDHVELFEASGVTAMVKLYVAGAVETQDYLACQGFSEVITTIGPSGFGKIRTGLEIGLIRTPEEAGISEFHDSVRRLVNDDPNDRYLRVRLGVASAEFIECLEGTLDHQYALLKRQGYEHKSSGKWDVH